MSLITDIKSMNNDEIRQLCSDLGLPKFRADQLYSWLQKVGVSSYDEMTNISKDLRQTLNEKYPLNCCEIELKRVSKID